MNKHRVGLLAWVTAALFAAVSTASRAEPGCTPTTASAGDVEFAVHGQHLRLPVHARLETVPSSYQGESFVHILRTVVVDFSDYRARWPDVLRAVLPHSGKYHRYFPHGMSVSVTPQGSMLSRAHVTYSNWNETCINVPEIRRWKFTTKRVCGTSKNFQTTSVTDVVSSVHASGGVYSLNTQVDVRAGRIDEAVKLLSTIFTGGELEDRIRALLDAAAAAAEAKVQASLDSTQAAVARELSALADPNGKLDLLWEYIDASFVNSDGAPALVLRSRTGKHIKPRTACLFIDGMGG